MSSFHQEATAGIIVEVVDSKQRCFRGEMDKMDNEQKLIVAILGGREVRRRFRQNIFAKNNPSKP